MAQNRTEILAVLQLLRKYNFKVSEQDEKSIFKWLKCLTNSNNNKTSNHHYQNAEEQLKKEANLTDIPDNVPIDSDVSSVLAAYKSEGDPDLYEYAYLELRRFVDESLDIYKVSTERL